MKTSIVSKISVTRLFSFKSCLETSVLEEIRFGESTQAGYFLNFLQNEVWCGLERAENELKTTKVSNQRLSLGFRNEYF
jgi:hypothetical protein